MGSKKDKQKSSTQGTGIPDERWRKLFGILSILSAIYLTIAFVSYLYTWKYDQDKVLHFTWSSFIQKDLAVENWLGRLGAFISNAFFYYGFGLPSMVVVILLLKLGVDLIKKNPMRPLFILARNLIAGMAFFSILLEFIFRSSGFTWGGAFGESLCLWLTNFLGTVGLFLLLLFSSFSYVVWRFNINLEQYQYSLAGIGMPAAFQSFSDRIEDFLSKYRSDIPDAEAIVREPIKKKKSPELLEDAIPKTDEDGVQEALGQLLDLELPVAALKAKGAYVPPVLEMEYVAPIEIPLDAEGEEPTLGGEEIADDDLEDDFIVESLSDDMNAAQAPALNDVIREKTLNDVLSSEPYDPTLDLRNYKYPELKLLQNYEEENTEIDRSELEANKDQIIRTLLDYKIEIIKIRATIGPTVTLYEIIPAPGVKISKIKNLEDDIALSLSALGIRIIAPIPGKGTIGIEVPNKNKHVVSLKEVLSSEKFQTAKMALPIALGKTISNEVFVADLAKMPHLLIAGATGQGKSVGINTVLMSLLYKKHPSQVKLVLVDPKKVELFPYANLEQHFLSFLPNEEEPILTETSKVIYTLNSLCIEMDNRYDLLKLARVRNIQEYNEKFVARRLNPLEGHKFLPYIVLVIDEFADLIMTAGKEVEMPIARLAQLARAIGIHLIIATQRPSVNIITGIIKANFPARLAFKVTSKVDSRTILDSGGAEQLIGRGDMLLSVGSSVVRLQCAFVDTPEVEDVIKFIADQPGFPEPFFLPEVKTEEDAGNGLVTIDELDDMFEDAARVIIGHQHGSTSMIQRKLQLGYNRAGRIMDQMERVGLVGPAQGSKPREVLVYSLDELENIMKTLKNRF
ncbi:MAG: DNA translocase FtsK [Saprospiraceae bacterium]|nr:DNA translocase FtsK [Saprospiraceae bacterium]